MKPAMKTLKMTLSAIAVGLALGTAPQPATSGAFHHDSHGFAHHPGFKAKVFNRVAAFPVFNNTDIDTETVAEIVAASGDGNTLIYTDSANAQLGFVDIADPASPQPAGTVNLNGEPTSVAVAGRYALAAVNTSLDFVNTAGELAVVDIATQQIVTVLDLGGQPDSVAVSPDQRYAAIAIENERDEDLGSGQPPQAPAGFLVIVDLVGAPGDWTTRQVDLSGVADLFPEDAEPEYVDINRRNIAAVTLQENNHIVLVDLSDGSIVDDYSAGSVDLEQIDATEEDPALISLTQSLDNVAREPDGISWLSNSRFAIANEGDLFGGSRGFSIFKKNGQVKYEAGNRLDHEVVRLGHYPDARSGNKGNEPENVEYARYGNDRLLFVGSERSSVVFVYDIGNRNRPRLLQTLPAGVGPEGLLAIPGRDLFVAASEEDDRGDKFRSVLNIYKRERSLAEYPTVRSVNRADGTPIPWSALSGLAMDRHRPGIAYTIHDSFYQQTRLFKMNVRHKPALIVEEIVLDDAMGKLAAVEPSLANGDGTVNLDAEGIATRVDGGFWIASEGDDSPAFGNLLVRVAADGLIEDVITLPASTSARLVRFGFEGVASVGSGADETLFVAFQREWIDDPDDHVRIGRYSVASGEWTFYYYPLEAPLSNNGGWVGLSEIVAVGDDEFAVIERDNQAGPDAVIKRIYSFSVAGLTPLADPQPGTTPAFPVLGKTLVRDLMPDLQAPAGLVLEKIEGLAVTRSGDALIVNDNDGVDDSNGETQLLRLRRLFK